MKFKDLKVMIDKMTPVTQEHEVHYRQLNPTKYVPVDLVNAIDTACPFFFRDMTPEAVYADLKETI